MQKIAALCTFFQNDINETHPELRKLEAAVHLNTESHNIFYTVFPVFSTGAIYYLGQ